MTLFFVILCGVCMCTSLFLFLHAMHMQIHSEHDPSQGGDERDGTAHQDVPVAGPVKDAVPSQSLEVTVINMLIFPCISICMLFC